MTSGFIASDGKDLDSRFVKTVNDGILNINGNVDVTSKKTCFRDMTDETTSSQTHRLKIERGRKVPSVLINWVFFWQKDHCREAYESELERAHLPETMRGEEYV